MYAASVMFNNILNDNINFDVPTDLSLINMLVKNNYLRTLFFNFLSSIVQIDRILSFSKHQQGRIPTEKKN